ncbi:hypothetical protein [Aeromonas bestiarum]|nr:hypothetical protein [Aeromonas bestiarum]
MTLGLIGKSHLIDVTVKVRLWWRRHLPQPVISLVQGFQNLVLR